MKILNEVGGLVRTLDLSPKSLGNAARGADKISGLALLVVWGAALVIFVLAVLTASQAGQARRQVIDAEAATPVVPSISYKTASKGDLTVLADRLKKRFPDIDFSVTQAPSLIISVAQAEKYRPFMDTLGSLNLMGGGDLRWTIDRLCIGPECAGSLMRAELKAERFSFTTPTTP
jgi:hypothetical protein